MSTPRPSKSGIAKAEAYELFLASYVHHVDNDFFGKPFLLEEWQWKNIWLPIFGTGHVECGRRFRRRYRRALIGLPRDGGKTEIAAGMLLTIASMEPTYGGEYAIIASSKEQARKTYGKIKAMIWQDEDLRAIWDINKDVIINRETDAKIMVLPYSEAAAQSFHFNVCIIDEIHVHRSDAVYQAVISGQKSIPNALTIITTTAGPERKGVLWDLIPVLEADPNAYTYWLGAKDTDDPLDPRVWDRVSPMSWITREDIADQLASATSINNFIRYTLNRFPSEKDSRHVIKQKDIRRCQRQEAQFDFSKTFTVGIDGASSDDYLAIVCYQRSDEGFDDFLEYVWGPDDADEDGYYPLPDVEDVMYELYHKRRHPLIGIDPARMTTLMKHIERYRGVKTFGLGQTDKVMCPASAMLTRSIHSGHARLKNCPMLAEHAGNCLEDESKAYGFRFTSTGYGKSKEHIDAAIAASMAMYIWNTQPEPPSYKGGVFSVTL